MTIKFNHILPNPILKDSVGDNSVWQNNFLIESGQSYLLNASSGRGKTTFVSILYGTRFDYEGQVYFDDRLISDFELSDWINLRTNQISAVFQTLNLFPKLSVFENIQIKNELTNYKTEKEIDEMLNALGVYDLKTKLVEQLSMGQKQRVAIIRALCQPFKWLFLDEPFSHLDTDNTTKALNLIIDECEINNGNFILTTLGETMNLKNCKLLNL